MGELNIKELPLKDARIITAQNHEDIRGSFSRVYCKRELSHIMGEEFVQVNHSISKKKGTVRGMHFQHPPYAEVKMLKCIRGRIFDVIVDIRKDSSTFLQWHGEILSEENRKMIYIPKGFAHGFQTLEDNCEILYFHSKEYSPSSEGAVNAIDPLLNIKWPLDITEISKKDIQHSLIDMNFKGIEVEL